MSFDPSMARADPPKPPSASPAAGTPAARVARWAFGLLTAAAALAALHFQPALMPGMFLLFSLAILAAAWAGGFVAGLLAAVSAGLGARWLGLAPFSQITVAYVPDQVQLIVFALLAGCLSAFGDALSSARRAAALNVAETERLERARQRLQGDAEAALEAARSSDKHLRELIDSVDAVVWEADPRSFQFSFASRSAESLLGQPLENWLEPGFWTSVVHPEDRPKAVLARQRVVEDGRSHRSEYRLVAPDGRTLWVQEEVLPAGEAGGPIRGVLRDITARKAAEEESQRSAVDTVAILESAPDAFVAMDDRGRITSWNAQAGALFGWSRQEAIGRKVAELIIPTALRQRHTHSLERFLAGGESALIGRRVEMPGLRKDGSEVPVELHVTAHRQGATWSFTAFLRDLSERRKSEEQIRHQLALTSAVTTHLGEGLYAMDPEGRLTLMNPAAERLLGWSESELIGKPVHDVTHSKRADGKPMPAEECPMIGVITSGTSVQVDDDVLVRKNGSSFPVSYTAAPIVGEGSVSGVVVTFRDETDRREEERKRQELLAREQEARKEAEAASRTKDEFLATLSHELRTPLNAIVGWAHLLRSGQLDAPTAARAVETIDRNAKAQNQLISDILDVSRIVTGKLRLSMEPIQPGPAVEAALDTVRPAAEAKEIELVSALDPAAGPVLADPNRLQQVVWNLLFNAIKFTPRGGRVEARVSRVDSRVEVAVQDTGPGIPPDFLPHVFERFRQGDSSSTRRHGGLGLGLSIVKHLVELHGGTVEADSAGVGQGATFTVKLPLLSAARPAGMSARVPAVAAGEAPAEEVPALEGVRVLLVDDDADGRDLISTVLGQRGARVTGTASVAEAMDALGKELPDVILSDIEMPDADGHSFIRKVRALPPDRGGAVPAAALTAYARTEDRMQALLSGFQMHVAKPVQPEELAAVVASLAGRRA
jgi:PAS domain S-box-containing protein